MPSRYFCHYCQVHIRIPSYIALPTCPYCQTQFVEEETSPPGTPSTHPIDPLPWLEPPPNLLDDDQAQDEWYDPWYLEFLPTPTYSSQQQQQQDDNDDDQQVWEQDEEDVIPWFPAEAGGDNDSTSSWVTEHDDDNDNDDDKSHNSDIQQQEQQEGDDEEQWVTEDDDDNDDNESTAYQLFLSIHNHHYHPSPSPSSSSSTLSSTPSSVGISVASSISSPSPIVSSSTGMQQQSSSSSTSTSSNHRQQQQSGLFRIERLLDMIYQGYSESDNELDDTHYHQGFMDNLMDIFSDPMETPQTSTNSDIEHCIERLSKRTLLDGESGTLQECTICQEPFGTSIELLQMPCLHEYHTPCLSQWLYVNATCPICRCPASSIIERTPPPPPPPIPLSPIIMQPQRRYSYPTLIPEDQLDDNDDDQLSEYYEVTDPPPIWARSSSSSTATTATTATGAATANSRSHLVYHHHLHDY